MKFLRLGIASPLVGLALLVTAPAAFAHTELTGSDPAEGASVPVAPRQIRLTFAEPVSLPANPITVTGPAGANWAIGTPTLTGAVVNVPVTPAGPGGPYTINYKVTAEDGDTVTGAIHFTLTTAAS